jgi:amino acid adenylation domain-containing protein/non-ribosomal peptide synthase protein (TIGR01720 family)
MDETVSRQAGNTGEPAPSAGPRLPRTAVHRLFELAAGRFPDHVAIEHGSARCTYRELEERANGLAGLLRELGAPREAFVGILATDPVEVAAAMLGTLKAGCAFVPLDPDLPDQRLSVLLADVEPAWIVAEAPWLERLAAARPEGLAALRVLRVGAGEAAAAPAGLEVHAAAAARAPRPPELTDDPEARCYVYFTSGSTGQPKGIVGRLKSIDHFIRWEVETIELGEGARVALLTTPSFDAYLRIFMPLAVGGTFCALPSRDVVLDGARLVDWLDGERIAVIHCVPTLFRSILAQQPGPGRFPALRWLLMAGERLLPADVARWTETFGDRVRLANLYGPTETTITKLCYFVQPEDGSRRSIPIGRPMRGAEAVVLDARDRPCAPGTVGEICIRTPFRAHGYLRRPDLDREVFIPNPLTGDPADVLYRTGDYGRVLKDGQFEYLGRRDQQVKIRGVRVELAEIEELLRRHPGVDDVAAAAREDAHGNAVLCAYVTGAAAGRAEELRELCARFLPGAMVPSVFVPLPALPRTASGKVDRRALPAPEEVLGALQGKVAPRDDVERRLAAIWAEVLRLELPEIGVEDNFFQLGGHSLSVLLVLARVTAAFNVEVPARLLFQYPTIAGMAPIVVQAMAAAGGAPTAAPLARVPRNQDHPASFAQERLWFLQRLEPASVAYNVAAAIHLTGDLDVPRLVQSLEAVVARHEALRTTFGDQDGRPVQRIAPPGPVRIPRVDLSALAVPHEEARRWIAREAGRPFDLERGPLLRLALLRLGERAHTVAMVAHHIVCDLWSLGLFTREVAALYAAFKADRPSPLPELPIQFVDFAAWQRACLHGDALASELVYWRNRLGQALDPLPLPTDRPRPAVRGALGAQRSFRFSRRLGEGLGELGRREGTTLFVVLLGAFQTLLGRYTGEPAVSVGSPVAGRYRLETENLIGFFINTLILRTPLDGDPPFRELVRRASATALEAQDHQSLPLEMLVEELHPARELSHTPLFQVWFTFRGQSPEPLRIPGLRCEEEGVDHGAAKWDLALFMGLDEDALAGTLEYDRTLFDATTIERTIGHLETLLGGAVASPGSRLSDLPLLSPPERSQLNQEWNRPGVSFPEPRRLHEIFQQQAARAPGATAVICGLESLTYGELAVRANRLARALCAEGVGPETTVGLLVERSVDLVVGILGILAAGGGYLPLDPGHPPERLVHALADAGARALVAQPHLCARLPVPPGLAVIEPDDPRLARLGADPLPTARTDLSGSLAYVIYTSGSTGVPKGTPVSHAQVTRLFAATAPWFAFGPDDIWTLFHSAAFDFSVWELWGALLHGGSVVVVPAAISRSPQAFYRLLVDEKVTVLSQTPSAFRQLMEADDEASEQARRELRLRWVIFGGEALEVEMLRPWWSRHAEARPRLVNMYGITETTVHVTWRSLAPADLALPFRGPIGVPLPDLVVRVLDRHGRQLPAGVPGEICVGGAGVARGYIGRPELTAARFVPDDLSQTAGARLYRSGDLGRWRAWGELESLGRIDHQVKVRGFRIELGEIEAALAAHPAVQQAVVVPRRGAERDIRLTGYVVPSPGAAPTLETLRGALAARLPDYMLPAALVLLEAMPLTPNGKADRRALARIEPHAPAPATGEAEPATPLEELLAEIWADVLGAARVGRRDNFFDLGGHSLLATRVASRLRQALGVEVPLLTLFEEPVLEGFARRVEEALALRHPVPPPILPVERTELLPLSFAQQRLWFLQQMEPGNCAYNLPLVVRIAGALEPAALRRSLAEVVRRHEVLRTAFVAERGEARQRVDPPPPAHLPVVDLRGLEEPARDRAAESLIERETRRVFDLACPPLMRALLLRIAEEEHLVVVVLHHIVADEWSHGVFLAELSALYEAFRSHRPSPLPELPVQYGDFAVWQRRWLTGPVLAELLDYWCARLAGAPVLGLFSDRPRPAVQTFRGASLPLPLPGLDEPLGALARHAGATPFMLLLAAFRALLCRYSGQVDIAVGTPIANRNRAETEPLIGFFVNTLVLRVGLDGDPSFRELVARERRAALEAYAYQDLPFERLVEALQPQRDLSRTPLFRVLFDLHNAPISALELADATLTPVDVEMGTAKLDLTLFAARHEGQWRAVLQFNTDLFDAVTVERLGHHFRALLAQALAWSEGPVAELDLLALSERQQLLEWSGQAAPPAAPPLVHQSFAEQARWSPDAVAIESAGESLSYAALNRRANRIAHLLAARGVGPEVSVGVALEPCPDLIATLLGVLKAGGAYVPLDPVYPQERLAWMATTAAISMVVTRRGLVDRFAGLAPGALILDENSGRLGSPRESDPESQVGEESLAYVLFTSGSTGRPKGVMISHGALARYVDWAAAAYGAQGGEGAPLHTSVGFDLSVTSLFVPLSAGRRVVLLPEADGGEGLVAALSGAPGYALVKLTPAHLEVVSHRLPAGAGASAVRTLVIGGEALTYERVAFWRTNAPGTRLVNEYGPTEAVVGCCVHEIAADEPGTGSVPIGRPVPYAWLRVLDRRLQEVPPGAAGELCIGGAALARGYFARPDLTAQVFVPDPAAAVPGARLYRTGDLARYLIDGRLQFLGRVDQQVKIRGFRIEPGEIEAALAAHPGVRDAVVILREDLPGHPCLVAYVAAQPALTVAELRDFLGRRLPTYMIPASFVVMDELPLTVHGKVDRAGLQALAGAEPDVSTSFEAPRTPVEQLLAQVWCRVLRRERVGIHDNFFEIGGDSILALQIVGQACRAGVRLTPRQMFQQQTIAGLAAVAATAPQEDLARGAVAGPVALSPIQSWFFERELPAAHHYNQSVMLELLLPFPVALWERALAWVVEHHDALRLRYERRPEGWLQTVLPPEKVAPEVVRIDLSMLSAGDRGRALEAAAGQVQAGFDLAAGPLLRLTLFDLAAGGPQRVLIAAHHLIIDGVSWEILLEDLESACLALSSGARPAQPYRTTPFKTWVERSAAHAARLEPELTHWLALARMAPPALPQDCAAGPDDEARARTVLVELGAEETRILLQERLAELRCRIDEALLTALLWAFSRWTGVAMLLVDVEGHGREDIGEELDLTRTIGWFTTLSPVLLDAEGAGSPLEVLRAVKQQLRAMPGRGLGYGLLRYLHADPEVRELLRRLPRAEVSFNYLGQVGVSVAQSRLWGGAAESRGAERSPLQPRAYRLSIDGAVVAGELRLGWTYSESLYERSTIEALGRAFTGALRELIERRDIIESYTPADFPDLDLTQEGLDRIFGELEETP